MHGIRTWLIAAAAFVVLVPAVVWLGIVFGRKAAKRNPGLAMSLMLFNSFFQLNPPPPPRAERIIKDEEDDEAAGAPPKG